MQGFATYEVVGTACEMTTLAAIHPGMGIGTALIQAVREAAETAGCMRLWLITTNDNTHAIRFYQKQGFSLVAVYIGALQRSRALKPAIPLIGMDGIPLLHEFEFEMAL